MLPRRQVLAVALSLVVVGSLIPGGAVALGDATDTPHGPAHIGLSEPRNADSTIDPGGESTDRTPSQELAKEFSARPTPASLQTDDISGSLSQTAYAITRGDSVEITFSHSGPATLTVGGEDTGYKLEVNVSGSGSSTVTIHTYNSTSGNPNDYVDGGTPTLVYPTGGLEKSLVPSVYLLNLTVQGQTEDLGRLVIQERPRATMQSHVAPGSLDTNEASFSDVKGEATPGSTIAKGDYAIIEVNATGLGAAIDPDDLDGDGGANGIEVYVEDLESPPNSDGDSFMASGKGTVTSFWDADSDTLLLAWDTRNVDLIGGSRTYNVTFRIVAENNNLLLEDSLEANTTVTVVKQRLNMDVDDGQLTVYPWESDVVTVAGSTTLAPGTTFEVRARAFEPRPFLKKVETTVTENRTFSADLDFAGEARGIEFPVWVHGHRDLGEYSIHLRETNATFDFANQTAPNGSTAWVHNVSLSVGGHLVLEDLNGTVRGVAGPIGESPVAAQNVTLDPPLNRSAYLTATAYMDWNQNGSFEPETDRIYATNGTNATQRSVVFVPETGEPRAPSAVNNSTTGNTTTVNTTTGNTTTMMNASTATTLSVQAQDPLTPGESAGNASLSLALPVASLLAAALLLRRRRQP